MEVKTPPDARVRLAMVTACARAGLAKAAALEVLAAVEADVERADASQAEVDELQARFRRELAASRVADGRTVARRVGGGGRRGRVARGRVGRGAAAGGEGGGDGVGADTMAADPRAGCPIPVTWGPRPRSSRSPSSSSSSSSDDGTDAVPTPSVSSSADDADEWSRGLEMWKHWLGLPSRYYDGASDATTPMDGPSATATPSSSGAARDDDDAPRGPAEEQERRYTKAEIAEAVRVLRDAASKRFPDDPDRALEVALEAANDGDAARVLRDEDRAAGDVD